MKWLVLPTVLLAASFCLGQAAQPNGSVDNRQAGSGEITVRGCVGMSAGDYILTEQDPGMTYELSANDKTRLRHYLGQRVEVVGTKSASTATSSDATMPTGSPASVTLHVHTIKTISKECRTR
jgi:hypothetical protein